MAAALFVIMLGIAVALAGGQVQGEPGAPETLPPEEAAKIILKKR